MSKILQIRVKFKSSNPLQDNLNSVIYLHFILSIYVLSVKFF